MKLPSRWPFLTILLCATSLVRADDPAVERARAELKPKLVTLRNDVPLDRAVKILQEETGNTIVDRRSQPGNPTLKLTLKDATFWEALDDITHQAKCGYSLYQQDGKLALVGHTAAAPEYELCGHLPAGRQACLRDARLRKRCELLQRASRTGLGATLSTVFP